MSAGIPGFGLSGLFFLACALLALPLEALRIAQGRSTGESRRRAVRHFTVAVAIVAAADLTFRFILLGNPEGPRGGASTAAGDVGHTQGADLFALPVGPIALTAALLVGLLVLAKALAGALALVGWASERMRGRRPARSSA